ncbi:hypothetical protein L218DRAFT_906921 [Marasmius fiardii PR-910]|nr:hypothetical protein L218DRAFT_906921 [Marasmius fiardii PR-910]
MSKMQAHRPILCDKCRYVANARDIRPPHTIESRFHHDDYIPSESELFYLENVLKEGEQELERYEKDIADLREILDRLETGKKAVELMASHCRGALSAHRRIPAEVWGIIFSTLCLSLHRYSFDSSSYQFGDSPLLGLPTTIISQVCTHWRNIVVEMPSLWSSINVDLDDTNYNVHIPLKVYLSNSKAHPLKLRISYPIADVPSWGPDVWATLSKHIFRSKELNMAVGHGAFIDDLCPVPLLTFDDLESFSEAVPIPDEATWPWFWQAIQEASKLVRFSSPNLRNNFVPFSQLTTWEIEGLAETGEVEDFINILQQCICLNSLTVEIASDVGQSPVGTRDVKLPSLRRLIVWAFRDEYDWLSSIFQSLDIPSLEFCDMYFPKWPVPSGLIAMIRRSSASLKHMILTSSLFWDNISSSDPTLFHVLQATSELTDFQFRFVGGGPDLDGSRLGLVDDVVSALFSKLQDDSRQFLPKLGLLSLQFPFITLSTQLVKRVLEVVSARQITRHPLTDLRLVRGYGGAQVETRYVVEPEILERIELLARSGVKVVIEDRTQVEKR